MYVPFKIEVNYQKDPKDQSVELDLQATWPAAKMSTFWPKKMDLKRKKKESNQEDR